MTAKEGKKEGGSPPSSSKEVVDREEQEQRRCPSVFERGREWKQNNRGPLKAALLWPSNPKAVVATQGARYSPNGLACLQTPNRWKSFRIIRFYAAALPAISPNSLLPNLSSNSSLSSYRHLPNSGSTTPSLQHVRPHALATPPAHGNRVLRRRRRTVVSFRYQCLRLVSQLA